MTKASQGRQGQRHVLQNVTGALAVTGASRRHVAVTSPPRGGQGQQLVFLGPFGALLLKRTKKP